MNAKIALPALTVLTILALRGCDSSYSKVANSMSPPNKWRALPTLTSSAAMNSK